MQFAVMAPGRFSCIQIRFALNMQVDGRNCYLGVPDCVCIFESVWKCLGVFLDVILLFPAATSFQDVIEVAVESPENI